MSAVADLTNALIARGMDAAEAAVLVVRAIAEATNSPPTVRRQSADETTEKRRAYDRERMRIRRQSADSPPTSAAPLSKSNTKIKKERVPASRLPEDWQPSEHDIEAAIRKGVPRERIPIVAEKFRNHWLAKPSKNTSTNWHLNWCTWVMREAEWAPKPAATAGPDKIVRFQEIAAKQLEERRLWLEKTGRGSG